MSNKNADHYFLKGGGEMGELIRAKDWSKTPLGDPAGWPQSLCTMVAVMLDNPFGMYIAWGDDYTQLYNDGYRPILGATKHPQALGISTRETFSEIWHIIESMFDGVMNGKAVGFPDFMLPLNRNGFVEECYFDFSYSPIRKDNGEVGGVLVTVIETTNKKKTEEALKESEQRFRAIADNIPNLGWMADAEGWIYWYNKKWYEYTGTTPKQMEGWGWQMVHDPVELPVVLERWKDSIATGHPFEMVFPIKGADGKFRHFLTRVLPVKDNEGKIIQWFGSNTDITPQKQIEEALKESEQRFRNTMKQAPVGITILRGPEYIVEMANDAYLQLVDKKEAEFVGNPLFTSLPEAKEAVHSLLDNVLNTGVPYHGNELPVPINRYGNQEEFYFDFLYHPLKEEDGKISGVIAIVTEVTEKVEARKKIEQNEQRLSIVVEASGLGTWELNLKTEKPTYSKRYLEILGGYKEDIQLTHAQLLEHWHPDDMPIREKAFKKAFATGYLHYESRLIWKDKSIHWMESKGKVFYDEENKPFKLIGTIRDITEAKDHEQELRESESKFRLLADSMPQHIWTSDTEGNLNYYNQSVLDYSGLTLEQINKDGWIQIVHPDDKERNIKEWMNSITTGTDFLFEHRFRRYDGEYRWQLSRAIPQRDANGKIQMWVGTSTDIQAQKTFTQELEEKVFSRTAELKASEEKFHNLFNLSPICKTLTNAQTGEIVMVNDAFTNIFGYSREESYSKTTAELGMLDPKWRETVINEIKAYGKIHNKELEFTKKSGEKFFALTSAEIINIEDKEYFLGAYNDISDRKKAEKNLERKNIELEMMNKELQSFAYISSHDLQEPLRKIQTFATLITEREENNLSDYGKNMFKRMYEAAQRMQTLIQDLLAYSRTSTTERRFETTDLNKIIAEVKEDFKEELKEKHATIEANQLCDADIIPFQFRQLMYNLIGNSLKFSNPENPPHIQIKSEIVKGIKVNNEKLSPQNKYCHITVADNGIGFEQQYSKKIFEVFQRLHGKNEYKGTGIGLSIVKKIVENHHGIITATGKLNKGATFDIYIPAT